jgi:phage terminase large subunit-like protein
MRFIETYAGYEGESELLYKLYETAVLNGRQLTAGEFPPGVFAESPKPTDPIPCYVNEAAGMFAYWDEGEQARRMPWQQGEEGRKYYSSEAATQTPNQMIRLHRNQWVSAESSFVPIEWWDACLNPLPLKPGEKTPLVIALDAAVSGDCFGMVMVSRDPLSPRDSIAVRMARKWDPPKGGKIDYVGPDQVVRDLCKTYNIVEICYDPYQLHDFCTRLQKQGVAWCNSFEQGEKRLKADKGLYDLIRDRKIRHDGNPELREHIVNSNSKQSKDESTKLRIIKKSENRHIDLCVCASMAAFECLRLNL